MVTDAVDLDDVLQFTDFQILLSPPLDDWGRTRYSIYHDWYITSQQCIALQSSNFGGLYNYERHCPLGLSVN